MKKLVSVFLLAAAFLGLSGPAFADGVTVPDATSQLSAITTSVASYSTVMFAIAIAAVGIMVGVKWIKRGRGAA